MGRGGGRARVQGGGRRGKRKEEKQTQREEEKYDGMRLHSTLYRAISRV